VSEIQTVLGRVPAGAVGFTLPHEHTRCVLWQIEARWDYWQLTGEEEVIAAELAHFSAAGGSCLVDVTLGSIGRDPARLRRLSEATGLHVVMGCGWYRQAYYPAEARIGRRSVDDLAAELVAEFEGGADGTGIRPGIIGEIGTDKPWLTGEEERVHRAVARAARATGMAVTTHAVMSDVGLAQMRVFEEEGLDPGRVVIGHADSNPRLEYHLGIIERGASVEFDFLGMSFTPAERHGEPRLIRLLLELLERGHAGHLLLSQDVCHDAQLKAFDGNGYDYIATTFLPRLRAAGVDESTIRTLTVDNPRRVLTLSAPDA
jgi:predicted metal-dependent phosphotriesterase family hydrolase